MPLPQLDQLRYAFVLLAAVVSALVSMSLMPSSAAVLEPAAPVSVLPALRVEGKAVQARDGSLSMIGVRERRVRRWEQAWIGMRDPGRLRRYGSVRANRSPVQVGRLWMRESQVRASAAALQLLGQPVKLREAGVEVTGYDGAAAGGSQLLRGDVVTGIDGRTVRDLHDFASSLQRSRSTTVQLELVRDGRTLQAQAALRTPDGRRSIGVHVRDAYHTTLPVRIEFRTPNSNGSSAGLAFALAVYEAQGPPILRGRRVTATGSIDERGRVYRVASVREKAAGAQRAGTDVFVVPLANADDARRGVADACERRRDQCMRVVGVRTLYEAVLQLEPKAVRERELVVNPRFDSSADTKPLEQCPAESSKLLRARCYADGFAMVAFKRGPGYAQQRLDALTLKDEFVGGLAHAISHRIGQGALARVQGDVARAMAERVDSGAGGYYHGVIMAAMADQPASTDFGEIVPRICVSVKDEVPLLRGGCYHALGHALMLQLNRDLPVSLSYCDSLDVEIDRTSCYIGVFMENTAQFRGVEPGAPSRFIKEDDPLYPCTVMLQRHKATCYEHVGLPLTVLLQVRWAEIGAVCRSVPPVDSQHCFASVGNYVSTRVRWKAAPGREKCAQMGPSERLCFEGLVRSFAHRSPDGSRAVELCTGAPRAWQPQCYSTIGAVLLKYGVARQRTLCRAIGGPHLARCFEGKYMNQVDPPATMGSAPV